jgi:hypothetical protein
MAGRLSSYKIQTEGQTLSLFHQTQKKKLQATNQTKVK